VSKLLERFVARHFNDYSNLLPALSRSGYSDGRRKNSGSAIHPVVVLCLGFGLGLVSGYITEWSEGWQPPAKKVFVYVLWSGGLGVVPQIKVVEK